MVINRIDYCNSVLYGIGDVLARLLQSVVNSAARLIARKRKYDSISGMIRDTLHWLPIRQRIEYKLAVTVFNCLHGAAPRYLMDMCQPVTIVSGRRGLRSAAHGDLIVPSTRTVTYGPRSFAVSGPTVWNSLPLALRNWTLTPAEFRHQLKTELFRRAYYARF
jgi:hypothetical protein